MTSNSACATTTCYPSYGRCYRPLCLTLPRGLLHLPRPQRVVRRLAIRRRRWHQVLPCLFPYDVHINCHRQLLSPLGVIVDTISLPSGGLGASLQGEARTYRAKSGRQYAGQILAECELQSHPCVGLTDSGVSCAAGSASRSQSGAAAAGEKLAQRLAILQPP